MGLTGHGWEPIAQTQKAWLLRQRSKAKKSTGPSMCTRKLPSSTICGPRSALNAERARGFRMLLWAEHWDLAGEESMLIVARHLGHQRQRRKIEEEAAALLQHLQETLGDPLAGLHLMVERAQDNLRRFKAKQPLVGHLLPYAKGEEAKRQGWHFHEEHGWIETP